MSFAALLVHRATVVRPTAVLDGFGLPTYDELNQPITEPVEQPGTWRCRIEPKDAREIANSNQQGGVVATHTVYGFPRDLTSGDRLEAADGRVFEVLNIDDAGGQGHHFEVQAREVAPVEVAEPAAS